MGWNYRVIKAEDQYSIHEVFYYEGGDGAVKGYTQEPSFPRGETLDDLRDDLARYRRALDFPVLEEGADGMLKEV